MLDAWFWLLSVRRLFLLLQKDPFMADESQNQIESDAMVRLSLASVPDQSNLMPPPQSHSSMNEPKQK